MGRQSYTKVRAGILILSHRRKAAIRLLAYLYGSEILLGITEGYVSVADTPHIGCGAVFYITVPKDDLPQVHARHCAFFPSEITEKPWETPYLRLISQDTHI
jgi:hypothetical protein